MCDDAGESSVQASTPKVASTAGDRGTKTDASRENLVKREHFIGKRPTGDRTRQRGNARRKGRRASTTISGGENPVADQHSEATPEEGHGDERTPSTAGKRAVVRARLNWAVPATR